MNKSQKRQLLQAQCNEITEYHIYRNLAKWTRSENNTRVLERIAAEELSHYKVLRQQTGKDIRPNQLKIRLFTTLSRVLGLSFGLRLMEKGESLAQSVYAAMSADGNDMTAMMEEEQRHEDEILNLIEEELIDYAGSVVLGLNDALMELTGALSGLTFALQDGRLIAITGFITGVAASMSMAASEFLSAREEADVHETKNPLKAAAYTGVAYILTVLVLISPYLFLSNIYLALACMLTLSVLIVLSYNFYITTAKGLKLWPRFRDMAGISLAVAAISFGVGMLVRHFFGLDI
ncbi:MAG: VIT1/CCC1 transporter family protein [Verrucomicrobia bacterium]|nr:VIT1/CCC1 transporter family protein [Verrucomicrobiota bacterium]